MKRLYYANASDTPPLPPKNPSYGYPQDGDRSLNRLPTTLGSYWHHMITEEFMNVIEGAGIEPDENNLHQLADIFEDFRQRAFKAEGFAGDAQDWANKAKEFAEAAQAEADSKVAQVREAGETQVAAVNAATAASREEIEQKTAELEEKLQTLIAALDAKGGEQVNLVKLQAQEILDAIQLSKNQVEELVNSAGYSMRWLTDAHEGTNLTAALTPNANAKVGDHIINSSGEVFELTELKGTEIVLGPCLAVFGDVGPMGPAPEISIEVSMLDSGARPEVERGGPDESPHFNFKIPKGDKGDPFVYSDFTAEQLQALKGPKGDKGDPLTFGDLTEEQKAELKGEKGDKGDPGEAADVSNLVPRTGNRGSLAGYQDTPTQEASAEKVYTVGKDSPDIFDFGGIGAIGTTDISSDDAASWIKVARLTSVSPQIVVGVGWSFVGGEAPTLETGGVLVFFKCNAKGYINYLSLTA